MIIFIALYQVQKCMMLYEERKIVMTISIQEMILRNGLYESYLINIQWNIQLNMM